MFDEIVPDKSLIRAIWMRALEGDSACLRLCAEYKWGKPREAPDLNVEEPVRGDTVYECVIAEPQSSTTWKTPADDPDDEDPDTPSRK